LKIFTLGCLSIGLTVFILACDFRNKDLKPPLEVFGEIKNDTIPAGEYFEGKVWFKYLLSDDSLHVYCHEPLTQKGDTFFYRRKVNASSFDKNGFSRQAFYIHVKLWRDNHDTTLKKEMQFWVKR
jgi:hypothetical protein